MLGTVDLGPSKRNKSLLCHKLFKSVDKDFSTCNYLFFYLEQFDCLKLGIAYKNKRYLNKTKHTSSLSMTRK